MLPSTTLRIRCTACWGLADLRSSPAPVYPRPVAFCLRARRHLYNRQAVTHPSTYDVTDADRRPADTTADPYLVLSAECAHPTRSPRLISLTGLDEVWIGRGSELEFVRAGARAVALSVPDGWASTRHARLIRSGGAWLVEDQGSRNGTRVDGQLVERTAALRERSILDLGKTFFVFREQGAPRLVDVLTPPFTLGEGLVTCSTLLRDDYEALLKVAASTVPILLLGESGTGKELAARAVHRASARPGKFVAVNCGALSDSLIDAQLFGHRRGAFTGANESGSGLIVAADRGTLFLDEVAELPLPVQVKLLRVLQEQEVLPLGAVSPVSVDLRVIAATCQDLAGAVRAARFRQDLYARIAGYGCTLPPLRDRLEDLGLLVGSLLRRLAPERAARLRLSRSSMRALFAHDWPLNVRELDQVLGVSLALSSDDEIDSIESLLTARVAAPRPTTTASDPDQLRARLVALLVQYQGNVSAVARDMNKARAQIRRWCKRFDLDPEHFRQ